MEVQQGCDGGDTATKRFARGSVRPVWISDKTVASSHMLGAFLRFVCENGTDPIEPYLPFMTIEHRMDEAIQAMAQRPESSLTYPRWCQDVGCERCTCGRSGYQFRWYASEREECYLGLIGPGSNLQPGVWRPDDERNGVSWRRHISLCQAAPVAADDPFRPAEKRVFQPATVVAGAL